MVRVLIDSTDDAAITRGLLRRHDPAGGCIVVHPTVATHSTQALAHDLLAALGRPVHRIALERLLGPSPAWRAVTAWLHADPVSDLVVLRAARLAPAGWNRLVELCAFTGTRLTLVCHTQPIPAPLIASLDGTGHQIVTNPALLEIPAPVPRPDRDPADTRQFTTLPRVAYSGVVRYRRHALDQLGAAEFARHDAIYQAAQASTQAWLDALPDHTEPGPATVMRSLTKLVHDSPSRTHTLARLRGAQAAFRWHGLNLALPITSRLLDASAEPGLTSTPVTEQVAAQVRAGIAHPVLAAALATALFTGIEPTALPTLMQSTLEPGCATLRIDRRVTVQPAPHLRPYKAHAFAPAVFYVPPAARPLLRAARAFNRPGPQEDSRQRLFAGTPLSERRITAAAERCGLLYQPRR